MPNAMDLMPMMSGKKLDKKLERNQGALDRIESRRQVSSKMENFLLARKKRAETKKKVVGALQGIKDKRQQMTPGVNY